MKNLHFELINPNEHLEIIVGLLQQLNPKMKLEYLKSTQEKMSSLPNYVCFGLFFNNVLIGISSGWTTVRIYCGKQLELDNVCLLYTSPSPRDS